MKSALVILFGVLLAAELSVGKYVRQKRTQDYEDDSEGPNTIRRQSSQPNINEFLHFSQNSLARISQRQVARYLNQINDSPSVQGSLNQNYAPEQSQLHFDLITKSHQVSVPLDSLSELIENPAFHKDWNVTVFVTGWSSNNQYHDNGIEAMRQAYRCRNRHNLLVVNVGQYVNTVKEWFTLNTETVGQWIGKALARQVHLVPAHRYHLIGHGIGAHVVGAAARHFYDVTGVQIPRVTGLDPANQYVHQEGGIVGLQHGDALFVDVIHSNNGILGERKPIGDADYYPNGVVGAQPGALDAVSAHYKAVHYWAETVTPGLEQSYLAVKGHSLESVRNQNENTEKVPMGYETPVTARGSYFLETNAQAPHGMDADYSHEIKCNLY